MYICNDCDGKFYEPDYRSYDEDMNGEGAWYTWHMNYCPICGSEEIEEYVSAEEI